MKRNGEAIEPGHLEAGPGTTPALAVGQSTEQLLIAEFPRLARLAFLLCGDQARADDAAADAIARVWERSREADIEHLKPYLQRTLVNLVARRSRRFWSEQRALERTVRLPASAGVGDSVAERTDIGRAIQSLPRNQGAVIILRYYEGLTEEEIAVVLSISPGTVKSRASRALRAMRARVGGGDDA
jgi:RNA polymerase sigma factor (sigma-70 family)